MQQKTPPSDAGKINREMLRAILGEDFAIEDATDARLAEAVLLKSQEEIRLAHQLVDDASSAVYVCDAETYELLYVNQACARMCGKPVAESRGKTCYAYLKGLDRPCEPCYMETSTPDEYTEREYSSPVTGKHYMTRGKFINWGGRQALVEYMNDETERVRLRQEIRQRYEHELKLRHEMVRDSDSYFQVNLTTGLIEEYHSGYEDALKLTGPTPTGEAFRNELLRRVAPEDRDEVADTFFRDGLLRYYEAGEYTVSKDFRRLMPDGEIRWLRGTATIMQKAGCDEIVAFVYSRNIDREKKEQLALDSILGEEIESSCIVNVKSGLAQLLKINDGLGQQIPDNQQFRYDDLAEQLIYKDVLEEDWPNCRPLSSLENLTQALEQAPAVICTYRTKDKGGGILRKSNRAFYLDATRQDIVLSRRDITAQHDAELKIESMRKNEELLRLVVEHSARVIYRYDIATREAVSVEPRASQAMGLPDYIPNMPESLIESGVIIPEDAEYIREIFATPRTRKSSDSIRLRVCNKDGLICWLNVKYTLVKDDGVPAAAVISCSDVTEQHERELAYARYQQSIDSATGEDTSYFETDLTADLVERQGGSMIPWELYIPGLSHSQVIDHLLRHNFADSSRETSRKLLSREHLLTLYADGHREIVHDWPVLLDDGQQHWVRGTLQMVSDPFSEHIKMFTQIKDITEEKQSSLEMQQRAETDGMTGLYNRTTAETLIEQRLARSDGSSCALLMADLDHLKAVNDSLGHAYGDKAIKCMAEALRGQFRQTDIVGRVGGDEFVVFLDGGGNEAMLHSTLTAFLRKLSAISIDEEGNVPLCGSVGAVIGTVGDETYEELFRKADRALYQVKRSGKNNYAIYTPEMEQEPYQYTGNTERLFLQADFFDNEELDHLLNAVSTIYSMVISVNLTQNKYYMMQYEDYTTTKCLNAGRFDELVAEGAETFHPEDRASFLAAFSRDALLAAYARGEKKVAHRGRQLGDDGVYHHVSTEVIFVKARNSEDILEITLAREIEDSQPLILKK